MEQKREEQEIQPHVIYGHRTRGQKLADAVSTFVGSWRFISIFIAILVLWILLNGWLLATQPWDAYPFILLNLTLSTLAALQAPIILMSQNRSAERDRRKAEMDLRIDTRSEQGVQEIKRELQEIKKMLQEQQDGKKGR